MKRTLLATLSLIVLAAAGCSPANRNPTPEQLRQDTAKATKTAAQDAKAVVEGVKDGLKSKVPAASGAVNINSASPDDLKSLPGIDDVRARRIIDRRPYDQTSDLVRKHAIPQDEYDRIASQIVTR